MGFTVQQATVAMLEEVVDVVGSWQHDGLPVHVLSLIHISEPTRPY